MVLLIVSQYYHSRHFYLVEYNPCTFLEQARHFIAELERYKRHKNRKNDAPYYGDVGEKFFKFGCSRYNVNDDGDIYFIIRGNVNACLQEIKEYWGVSRRESTGFQRKVILENICLHHNQAEVWEIVDKHFKLV